MKIRKSLKITGVIISAILFIVSCIGIGTTLMNKNIINGSKEIYSYTNKYNYDYTVNVKNNKYIDSKTLDMKQEAYITALIDNIDLNLNYDYESNTKSEINYKYTIDGKINAIYSKDGIESNVWQKEYVLKEETANTEDTNKININEKIKLDLKEQNQLVKDFETEMGMTLDAKYIVTLTVKTDTNVDGTDANNEYKSSIEIDLGKKTTTISGENNLEQNRQISKQYEENGKINVFSLIVYIVMLIFSIYVFVKIFNKQTINIVRNGYRQELNKILRICEEKIVQVSSDPVTGKENVIDVKDFGEMIKVSEELFKPILYWYCEEDEEAHFYVLSDDMTYRFVLEK